MEQRLLCADIGTSSLKAALIGEEGTIFASCRIRFPRPDGTDAAVHWFEAFCDAARRLFAAEPAADTIAGIVISGNGPTITAVSGSVPERDTPPYTLLWNVPADIPSENAVKGESLFITRFSLFRKTAPEQWSAARYILSGPEYLIWRLTGAAVTILPEERFRAAYWTDEALAENGIDQDRLPPFVPPGFRAGHLTAEAAEALGLRAGTLWKVPVYCGVPDWIAALIGTDTLSPGRACDRAGTSEGLNVCVPAPLEAQGIRTLPSVIPGLFNAGYLLPSTGARFSDYRRNSRFCDLSSEETMKLILALPEESNERRLVTEIAFEVRQGTEALRKAGADFAALRLSGGQARNGPWNQFKADVLGLPLELTASPDGELTGDAVIGFTGMGCFGSIAEGAGKLVSVSQVFYPDEKKHERYSELYEHIQDT